MMFGVGGHPGFRVPLAEDTAFEDYELRFSQPCHPDRIGFTEACFLNGHDTPYPLENGTMLRLRHDLFDEDAIVLKNMARRVTLCSAKTNRSVTVTYPQMPYLGIWHMPHRCAVCLHRAVGVASVTAGRGGGAELQERSHSPCTGSRIRKHLEHCAHGGMSMYDVVALGELLIDFTTQSTDADGYPTMAAHPGGAPAISLPPLPSSAAKLRCLARSARIRLENC